MLETGAWFGELSLLDSSPRTHDATALSDGRLLAVPAAAFGRSMQSLPFAHAIAALLASRVRSLYGLLEDASPSGLRARLARRLLSLAESGSATRRGVTLPQESLAMMLGVSRQTLSMELRALADAGAIARGYRRIEILSVSALRRLGS